MPVGLADALPARKQATAAVAAMRKRSEEHTSELQSQSNLVCRLLLEKKKIFHRLHRVLNLPNIQSDFFLNRCTSNHHRLHARYQARLSDLLPQAITHRRIVSSIQAIL